MNIHFTDDDDEKEVKQEVIWTIIINIYQNNECINYNLKSSVVVHICWISQDTI